MKPKPEIHPNAMVWRISEGAPMGEWVEKSGPGIRLKNRDGSGVVYDSLITSSYDLSDGAETSELPPDTMSGELFDELFASKSGEPKAADE